ncbi:hypothetical protein GOP47_0005140, partial [Adiantum capillus-veneris]
EDAATTAFILEDSIGCCHSFYAPSVLCKVVDLIRNESNDWLDVRQEGDDGEAAEGTRIRYDLNFVVYDRNIPRPNKKVTTLIVDGTGVNLTLSKMFQVSTYACKYALKNMEKGRFSPLYVELWGESNWRYGILYPSGVVLLEDGEISATSYSMGKLENMLREKEKEDDVKGRVALRMASLDGHTRVDNAWTSVRPYKKRRT